MSTFETIKDPESVVDYVINWTSALNGDTISTSEWEATPNGVTIDSDVNDTTSATVWVSGGTLGNRCNLENKVVTNNGRTLVRSILITIQDR
jgi:hypothetical protein